MPALARIVAIAMVQGADAGLAELDASGIADHHRAFAVRAHLLELTGDLPAARASYEEAARRTLSVPERQYLNAKGASL